MRSVMMGFCDADGDGDVVRSESAALIHNAQES